MIESTGSTCDPPVKPTQAVRLVIAGLKAELGAHLGSPPPYAHRCCRASRWILRIVRSRLASLLHLISAARASLTSLPPRVSARALSSLACLSLAVLLHIPHILPVLPIVNIRRRTATVLPASPHHILAPSPLYSTRWKTN
ncbi:uncharacterized protein DS421_11g328370 [Arachis hypogaea]|nr:uncharacterized protein DS421_11g328370 [Arachis hypogaea]